MKLFLIYKLMVSSQQNLFNILIKQENWDLEKLSD